MYLFVGSSTYHTKLQFLDQVQCGFTEGSEKSTCPNVHQERLGRCGNE